MIRFLILPLLLLLAAPVSAQKAKVALKLTQASQKFVDNDFWGALNLYRQADKADPGNPTIIYRIGEVQYYLKHYSIAKEYFERAEGMDKEVNPALPLMQAYTFHRLAELDPAIEKYREYRESVSENKAEKVDVKGMIDQCLYAKEMMASPKEVSIKNLDQEINSRFDDYAPSITSDGRLMVFTSRRPTTGNNIVDEAGDFKYFEDIYYSEWDADNNEWLTAELFDENVNSQTHDAVLSIAPDGKKLFVYKNNTRMAGDIFTSDLIEDRWTIPQKFARPINSSYFESSVSITADGNTMYFISERASGLGRGDIYMTQKSGTDSWSKPVNLGEVINTVSDEKFVFIHPNGNTLFFSSNGHLTMGSYDIFRSEFKDGEWTTPVNLGYPINTVNEESTFSMTADNKTLLISAEYENGMGERDIYSVDVSNADILTSLNIDSDMLTTYRNVSVYGHAKDGKGAPIAFQDIRVIEPKSEELIYTGRTDRRGYFEVSVPRGMNYELEVKTNDGEQERFKINMKSLDDWESSMKMDVDF